MTQHGIPDESNPEPVATMPSLSLIIRDLIGDLKQISAHVDAYSATAAISVAICNANVRSGSTANEPALWSSGLFPETPRKLT
jgi:hypothetical protein